MTQRMTFSVHDLPCNDLHLTPTAEAIVNALLCDVCGGSGKDIIKWDDDGWDRYDCEHCTAHPGLDPDVVRNAGPLRFNTMSIPAGIRAFVFIPVDA